MRVSSWLSYLVNPVHVSNRSSAIIALIAALFLLTSALLVPASIRGMSLAGRVPIALEETIDESEALEAFRSSGLTDVLCESTQMVEISDFVGIIRMTLLESRRRLIPSDPRNDPYLSNLSAYFRRSINGKNYRIFYIHSSRIALAERALSRWEGRSLSGFNHTTTIPALPLVPMLAALFMASFRQSSRVRRLILLLPWLPLWFSSQAPLVLAGLLAFCAMARVDTVYHLYISKKTRLLPFSMLSAFLPYGIMALVLTLLAPQGAATFFCSVICALALFTLSIRLNPLFRRFSPAHPIFNPLPINPRVLFFSKAWLPGPESPIIALACILVMGISLLPGSSQTTQSVSGLEMPMQKSRMRIPSSISAIPALLAERQENDLPVLPDYFAHRAYQESLSYGRFGMHRYGFPRDVSIPRYSINGDRIESRMEILEDFSASWMQERIREARQAGVMAFSISGDDFFSLTLENDHPRALPGAKRLEPVDVLVYIIVLVPFAAGLLVKTRQRHERSVQTAQNLRQEA